MRNLSKQSLVSKLKLISLLFVITFSSSAIAKDMNLLTLVEKNLLVRNVASAIRENYFDEDKANKISKELLEKYEGGEIAKSFKHQGLADEVNQYLIKADRHFKLIYSAKTEKTKRQMRRVVRSSESALLRRNFGFAEINILTGNVGYIKLNEFADIAGAERVATAALNFIANTEAVIFDLRKNHGGYPSMVQFLISHFIAPGGKTLINTFVSRRADSPRELWSLKQHPSGNRIRVPLYVLTSANTGSAAEAFPYHLKAMRRATIIGEKTYGAGNPGRSFPIEGTDYSLFISTGGARNPITGTNWEGVGAIPNISVAANSALDVALLEIYDKLYLETNDPTQNKALTWAAELLSNKLNPIRLDESEMEKYVGEFGVRKIFIKNSELKYIRKGSQMLTLVPLGNHRFTFLENQDLRIIITIAKSGIPESLSLRLPNGQVIDSENDLKS